MKFTATIILMALAIISGCEKLSLTVPTTGAPVFGQGTMETQEYPVGNENLATTAVDNPSADRSQQGLASNLAMHQKYIKTVETLLKVQQENNDLKEQNRVLAQQIATTTEELDDANDELADANEMLLTLSADLKKWKMDIFVYRKELLSTTNQQTEYLKLILTALGAETPDGIAPHKDDSTKTEATAYKRP